MHQTLISAMEKNQLGKGNREGQDGGRCYYAIYHKSHMQGDDLYAET